ncbi:MAG: hypothetical protein M3Y22_06170 [Pseudomonadota bacterium]|nr:hypothetical protein [Pseudomonadota bacterium]
MKTLHAMSLEELLNDDLTRAVMRADHVDRASLETMMIQVGRQRRLDALSRRCGPPGRISQQWKRRRNTLNGAAVLNAIAARWRIGLFTSFDPQKARLRWTTLNDGCVAKIRAMRSHKPSAAR